MRTRVASLVTCFVLLAGCGRDPAAAPELVSDETIDLVPDYEVSPAAEIDGAGIGASLFPRDLRLTPEQKAAIQALHEAFMAANAADLAELRKIEAAAKEARQAGKSREEIRAILARALPIRERLDAAFAKLQEAIWAIYTPEQRAWIEAHRPRACGRDGGPQLTEQQIAAIRALRDAFLQAVKADLELIKAVAKEARAAREAGATREEVAAILAKAAPAHERVEAAERKLLADILALLTPEQRAARCFPIGRLLGGGR